MRVVLLFLFFVWASALAAQDTSAHQPSIAEAERIIYHLASDSLRGRGNGTAELKNAAQFIAAHFNAAGLKPFPGADSFFVPFAVAVENKKKKDKGTILQNVVGVIEGDSLAHEVIVFSAHYDHVGVGKKTKRDSIYNGANDNASGTTALLLLAKYFGAAKNNQRSLVFCAFSGEENGLLGSLSFASRLKPESVKAVINIEMVGLASFGFGKFAITGADYSTLTKIFDAAAPKIRIDHRVTDSERQLFYRSDNAAFAYAGVAAPHTIMTSDDLTDACYHKPCDEVKRLNLPHLVQIVNTIIKASAPVISGAATPRRLQKI